jgi:hypothetical protein
MDSIENSVASRPEEMPAREGPTKNPMAKAGSHVFWDASRPNFSWQPFG